MDRSRQLGEGSIPKLLMQYSIPAITGMLVNALYNIVDRAFVGNGVNTDAIAGINIGMPFMTIQMAFGMLVGVGATALISIRLGEGKKEEAEKIAANAMVLLVIISLLMTIFGLIFINPMLSRAGASASVLPYARAYLSIILFGAIFQSIGFGMNNMIRADGNPKVAMGTMLIGAVMNAIFCSIFIFGFHWGIRGAALATVMAQAISATWVLSYFLTGRSMIKIRRKNLRLRREVVMKVLAIGSAPFAMQMVASVLIFILNKKLEQYGSDAAVAGMGVINSLSMLIMMPIFGINQGAQPIIGFNYGAKKYDRVKQTLKLAIMAATVVVTIGFIVTRLIPRQLIMIFNHTDEEFIAFGVHALKVYLMMLPIIGFQIVSANYFQAIGKPKHAMFLSLSRQLVLLIPAIFIFSHFFGIDGVLAAGPFSDLGSSLITGAWLYREVRRLNRRIEGTPTLA